MTNKNISCPQCGGKGRAVASIVAAETSSENSSSTTSGVVPGIGAITSGIAAGIGFIRTKTTTQTESSSNLAKIFQPLEKPKPSEPSRDPTSSALMLGGLLILISITVSRAIFGDSEYYNPYYIESNDSFVSALGNLMRGPTPYIIAGLAVTIGIILYFTHINSKSFKKEKERLEKSYQKQLKKLQEQEKRYEEISYCYDCHIIFDRNENHYFANRENYLLLLSNS